MPKAKTENEKKKRRVFVAAGLLASLQAEIIEWEKQHAALPARWLAGKNLHITLVPPWYEDDLESVRRRLSEVRAGSFAIHFERVSLGPDPSRPRLIWAEGETPKALVALRLNVHRALGIEPERRPFRLHLTLARFRPEDLNEFPARRLDEKVDWRARVDSFALMESRLSRQGADYENLFEFDLK